MNHNKTPTPLTEADLWYLTRGKAEAVDAAATDTKAKTPLVSRRWSLVTYALAVIYSLAAVAIYCDTMFWRP